MAVYSLQCLVFIDSKVQNKTKCGSMEAAARVMLIHAVVEVVLSLVSYLKYISMSIRIYLKYSLCIMAHFRIIHTILLVYNY